MKQLADDAVVQYREGYRKGQIDAINGRVKYVLREQPDKSTQWTEVE